MNFYKTYKKSRQLRKIYRKLSKPLKKIDIYDINSLSDKTGAIEELIDFCISDQNIQLLMKDYNTDKEVLREIYNKLITIGAGQYAGRHYVAASSLIFPSTLKFLLNHFKDDTFSINNWDNYDSSLFIANRLIDYFKNNENGEVTY